MNLPFPRTGCASWSIAGGHGGWTRQVQRSIGGRSDWRRAPSCTGGLAGRRARWAKFRTRYALELTQNREKLVCLQAVAAERPMTLLYSARDPVHNGAAVLREV